MIRGYAALATVLTTSAMLTLLAFSASADALSAHAEFVQFVQYQQARRAAAVCANTAAHATRFAHREFYGTSKRLKSDTDVLCTSFQHIEQTRVIIKAEGMYRTSRASSHLTIPR